MVTKTNGDLASFDDYFQTQLEMEPQTAYMGMLGRQQFGGTRPMQQRARDYYGNQFSDVYNKFLGVKGQELRDRTDPSKMTSFTDYIEQAATENPYTHRYAARTPQQRGVSTRQFAPSTRFLLY